jgi:hypothetical protein
MKNGTEMDKKFTGVKMATGMWWCLLHHLVLVLVHLFLSTQE